MKEKIKIMVIDDSLLFRNWLIDSLNQDPRFQVVGYGANAYEARQKIPLCDPDILTLDIEMPGMSGLEFLKEYLPEHPIPVILVSSLNMRVFDALSAGAVDFVRKPDPEHGFGRENFLSSLKAKLVIASYAHVRLPQETASSRNAKTAAEKMAPRTTAAKVSPATSPSRTFSPLRSEEAVDLIAIGASTGGTEAILSILRQFPASMPGIVVTQHMPAGFTAMYAERLNRICKLEVKEAKHGDRVRPGLALLAPGGLQMRVVRIGSGYGVSCTKEEKVNGHSPSVDVLFDSVAVHARNRAIGVILTGMGADGAAGLLRMRKNGAYTIGQDKSSCVVYGMPMEAYKIGAVSIQCSLAAIPQAVLSRLGQKRL